MRKIRLDLDKLDVETFDTSAADSDGRGTVHGHDYSQVGTCDARVATCQPGGTCRCATLKTCTVLFDDVI
ncbi:MAG: hypothetical protein JWM27_1311 [Gemmatimonadetes bacterium]|nr:hypothetical protein [Gemmatimonadota bacterium]